MTSLVDARNTHLMVRKWFTRGWTLQAIADASGVSRTTVANLLNFSMTNCSATTRDAIAGLTRPLLHRHAVMVPALATQRRVRHLQWCGWPQRLIADRVGISKPSVSDLVNGKTVCVTKYVERKVERVFEDMWQTDGGDVRSKKHARRQGFVPITAWSDIHDPCEQPKEVAA